MRMPVKAVLAAVLAGAAVLGCSKKDDGGSYGANGQSAGQASGEADAAARPGAPGGAAATATDFQAGAFDSALALWLAGDADGAVKHFVAIDWGNRGIFGEESVFRISEAEFARLSPGRRAAVQEEAMEATKAVRELARQVVDRGKAFAGQGHGAAAKAHYDAVAGCGAALAGAERLELVRMVGEALRKFAAAQGN